MKKKIDYKRFVDTDEDAPFIKIIKKSNVVPTDETPKPEETKIEEMDMPFEGANWYNEMPDYSDFISDEDILTIQKNTAMDDIQKRFIWLAFAEKKTYSEIEKELNVTRKELTTWTKEFESEWRPISAIKFIHTVKKMTIDFKKFYDWYKSIELNKKCFYCDITEPEIKILFNKIPSLTKRNRGKKLELDRKEPNLPYDNTDNIVYACYWCNNAKTDTFTHEEFKEVGQVISRIWKKRLEL